MSLLRLLLLVSKTGPGRRTHRWIGALFELTAAVGMATDPVVGGGVPGGRVGVQVDVVAGHRQHFVDGEQVRTVRQAPRYPMQFMLAVYEFRDDDGTPAGTYPKEFVVDYFRG